VYCLWIGKDIDKPAREGHLPRLPLEAVHVERASATQALLRLQAGPVDLVLAHWSALGPDGAAWCRDLYQHSPAPLIVITRAHDAVAGIVALESGACDVVHEGVPAAELLARMRAAVRRARRAF
jgi:DNA-binding response OmpR family regulator